MKSALKILALVLVVGAIALFFFLRSLGPTDPARLAPADAVVFHSIPDGMRTQRRWQNSALFKIGQEPEVREFLQKPLARLEAMGLGEAREILHDLRPARFFSVILEGEPSRFSWYGGFQFFGGKPALDRALDRLRRHLNDAKPSASGEKVVSDYQGTQVVRTDHGAFSLFTAVQGRWCFLALGEKAMHSALDRAAGRAKSPNLAESAEFQAAIRELPRDPDMLGYVRLQPLVDMVLAAGQAAGAQIIPGQVEELRRIKSVSFGERLEGANFRDVVFVQMDFAKADAPVLRHEGIRFAPAQTAFYLGTILDWESAQSAWAAAPMAPMLTRSLEALGLSMDDLPKALGTEVNISASWPKDSMRPELLLTMPLRDPALARRWLDTLTAQNPRIETSEDAHGAYFLIPSANPIVRPAIGFSQNFLFAGIGETEVRRAAASQGGESLANAPVFQSVNGIFEKPNEVFGYINTALLFDRAYAQFQPVLAFGAALMPGVSQYIDVAKLPPSSAISAHLDPITYSAGRVPGGYLMESRGPITFHQAVLLGAGGTLLQKFPQW